jgi:hypothetical protein
MWLERLYDEFTTPTRGRADPRMFLGIMFVALALLMFVVGGVFAAMTGGTSSVVFAVGFVFVVLGAFVFLALGSRQGSPKGPSPSGACPRCGAPPGPALSAHGLTKCPHCGEPYFAS